MRKLFSIILALALLVSVSTAALAEYTLSEPGELPIVTDGGPANLRVFMVSPSFVENMETNYATTWYEEKTGVHIEWMLASQADGADKLSMILASNSKTEMPDVFFTGMSRQVVDAYGAQGILLDLTDYIDQYGVNMKALKEHNPAFVDEMVSYDGGTYFLSRYYETVHLRNTQKIWVNQKWLANVNMEVPTTTDEFYEMLKAFKENDANGNGDANDEIPMIYYEGWAAQAPNGLMQAFTYYSVQNNFLFVEDDQVKVAYAEEGYREGLRYIKKLYDEGLLDNELFSMTTEQAKALAADPNGNRLGVVVGGTVGCVDMASEDIYDFVVIEPLTGPTGLKEASREFVSPAPFFAISAYCEIPEIAYRWADAQIYDSVEDIKNGDYTWLNLWYGEQGVGWDVADEGGTGFTGDPAAYKWLFNWGEELNTHWYENFLINMPEGWKPLIQNEAGAGYNQEQVLFDSTKTKLEPYLVDKTLRMPSMEEDLSVEVAQYTTTFDNYRKEMMAKFVRGDADLDADWDSYLAELDNIGLQQYLAIFQDILDAK